MHQMAQAMTREQTELGDCHLAQARSKRHERAQQGNEPAEKNDGLPPAAKPCLGPVEVLMRQEDVLAHLVDESSPAVTPDAVAGQRAQELAKNGHDDHHGQRQRLALARNLPAGEDAAVNEGELGAHGEPHGRDEAQREHCAVAGRFEKFLHALPCLRRRYGRHLWRAGTAAQFSAPRWVATCYRDVPPEVTAGRVVVVVGGRVVVVVVGLVCGVVVDGALLVVLVVDGLGVDGVLGVDVVSRLLLCPGGTAGVRRGDGAGVFELADDPGCSLATTTPMNAVAPPATMTAVLVNRLMLT